MSLNREQTVTPVTEECPVCIENYTKRRVKIDCPSCGYSVCVGCTKTYLLSTPHDPHCMNCNRGWDRDMQYELLGKSFVNGDLNKHRVCMLYDKERSMFPTTQSYVDSICELDVILKKQEEITEQIRRLKREYNELDQEKYIIDRHLSSGERYKKTIDNLLKCTYDNCHGYIRDNECRVCHNHMCRKCLVIVENSIALKEHRCDKDVLESAQLILKSSKPCPTCGTRISKVSGCDQMWCPECEMSFSWRTGMVDTGRVHNPHFYEYQLRRGNRGDGNINRNIGDVVCGGIVTFRTLNNKIRKMSNSVSEQYDKQMIKTMIGNMFDCHRVILHFQNTVVEQLRRELQIGKRGVNNIKERANFMMNKITEEQFKRVIIKKDKKREKDQSCLHIYESLVTMFTERINTYVESPNSSVEYLIDTIEELVYIRDYIQEQFIRVSKNYNVVIECFDTDKGTFSTIVRKF